jgi:hypothetical protein
MERPGTFLGGQFLDGTEDPTRMNCPTTRVICGSGTTCRKTVRKGGWSRRSRPKNKRGPGP